MCLRSGGWDRDKPRLIRPWLNHVLFDNDIEITSILTTTAFNVAPMAAKRRHSSASSDDPIYKKARKSEGDDHLSALSSELLIRILHLLPISTLIQVQLVSHRFYTTAGDSQIWKNLYYNRFVLPRALRIPGFKSTSTQSDDRLHFSSRRSKWLDEETLVTGKKGDTNWKNQYKLRHNWSIGACEVQEIHVADRPSVPEMLVRLAEGMVVTVDKEEGLRAWKLKGKELIAKCALGGLVPTCLAVDEREEGEGLGIAVGFVDGGWSTFRLGVPSKIFTKVHSHPASSNGMLGAVAYAHPYILTITDAQLLSLYTFDPKPAPLEPSDPSLEIDTDLSPSSPQQPEGEETPTSSSPLTSTMKPLQASLLASLRSHTSWPPLSLSIRTTPSTLIASIAYSLPTYLSGYTIGLQELHLSLSTGQMTFSRLASSLPQGFSSLLTPPASATTPPDSSPNLGTVLGGLSASQTRPTTLSYSHPYILATHPDNTLTLYLCTSSSATLSISAGTKLWGHTSSVASAEITPRGKAVSVSTRGDELRVWELEGGIGSPSGSAARRRHRAKIGPAKGAVEKSVRIRPEGMEEPTGKGWEDEVQARKQWVGFDEEVVIVLKESRSGTQALMVYDFT